jgi:hypothetical protein
VIQWLIVVATQLLMLTTAEQSMAFSDSPHQEAISGKDLLVQFTWSWPEFIQFSSLRACFIEWCIEIQSRMKL